MFSSSGSSGSNNYDDGNPKIFSMRNIWEKSQRIKQRKARRINKNKQKYNVPIIEDNFNIDNFINTESYKHRIYLGFPVSAVAVSPNAKYLATGAAEEIWTCPCDYTNRINDSFCQKCRSSKCPEYTTAIKVFPLDSPTKPAEKDHYFICYGPISVVALAFSHDSQCLFALGLDADNVSTFFCFVIPQEAPSDTRQAMRALCPEKNLFFFEKTATIMDHCSLNYWGKDLVCFNQDLSVDCYFASQSGLEHYCSIATTATVLCCVLVEPRSAHLTQARLSLTTLDKYFVIYQLPRPKIDRRSIGGRSYSETSDSSLESLKPPPKVTFQESKESLDYADNIDEHKNLHDPNSIRANVLEEKRRFLRQRRKSNSPYAETNFSITESAGIPKVATSIKDKNRFLRSHKGSPHAGKLSRKQILQSCGAKLLYELGTDNHICCMTAAENTDIVAFAVVEVEVVVVRRITHEIEKITSENVIPLLAQMEEWEVVLRLPIDSRVDVTGLSISPNGHSLAVATIQPQTEKAKNKCSTFICHIKTGVRVKRIDLLTDLDADDNTGYNQSACSCFAPDGKVIYTTFAEQVIMERVNSGVSVSACFKFSKPVSLVQLSEDGRRIAICLQNKHVQVYNVQDIEKATREKEFRGVVPVFELNKFMKVKSVVFSKDGKYVMLAVGEPPDSKEQVMIFREHLPQKGGQSVWHELQPIYCEAFVEMASATSGEATYLALATHHKVDIHSFQKDSSSIISAISFPDKEDHIRAIAFSSDAHCFAAATTEKLRCYKLLPFLEESTKSAFFEKRMTCVKGISLSPNAEALVASYGIFGQMTVFNLSKGTTVVSKQMKANILAVSFVTSSHIVASVENEKMIIIYEADTLRPCRFLPTNRYQDFRGSHSMSVSYAGTLASFTMESHVYIYGFSDPFKGHKIYDPPSYPVFLEIAMDQENLRQLVRCEPELVNQRCPTSKKSALQYCVEKDLHESMDILLGAKITLALSFDKDGKSALSVAASKYSPAMWLQPILDAIANRRVSNENESLRVLLEGMVELESGKKENLFEHLGLKHSKIFLDFISKMQLAEADVSIAQAFDRSLLSSIHYSQYVTSPHKASLTIWKKFNVEGGNDEESSEGSTRKLTAQNATSTSELNVTVHRIPFKGFSMPLKRTNKYKVTPIQVILRACEKENNATVFSEGTIARHVLNCQWKLLSRLFRIEFNFFLLYLILCSLYSYNVASFLASEDAASQAISVLAALIILFVSVIFLMLELHEYLINYKWNGNIIRTLKHHLSLGNINDFAAFAIQVIVSTFILNITIGHASDLDIQLANGVQRLNSLGIIILYLKLLHYAKGFRKWSQTIQIFFRITAYMKRFFLVIVVIAIGYAFAFSALLIDDPLNRFPDPFISFIHMVFYLFGVLDNIDELLQQGFLPTFLFMTFMILEVIVLLNLMITVMGDSYNRVFKIAEHGIYTNRADLVVQLEHRYYLFHRGKSVMSEDCDNSSPWVHVLQPVGVKKDDENQQDRMFSINERYKEKLEEKVTSRIDTLENEVLPAMEQKLDKKLDRIEKLLMQMLKEDTKREDAVPSIKESFLSAIPKF